MTCFICSKLLTKRHPNWKSTRTVLRFEGPFDDIRYVRNGPVDLVSAFLCTLRVVPGKVADRFGQWTPSNDHTIPAVKITNMGTSDFINDTNDDVKASSDITIAISPEASVIPDVATSDPITLLNEDDDVFLSNLVLDTLEKHEPQSLWIDDASDDASLFAGLEDSSSVTSMDALLFDKFLLDDDDNDEWL